jgi:hypothetical protein
MSRENIYYNTSMKHIIDYGHYIYLQHEFNFTTGTLGAYAVFMKFTIERNPL